MPPPNSFAGATPVSRAQKVAAGFGALMRAIPLTLRGGALLATKRTVLDQTLLASFKTILEQSKGQLAGLTPPDNAERKDTFLDVSKALVDLLHSLVETCQKLTLPDLMTLKIAPGDQEEVKIDFFGIKFSISVGQYNALKSLLGMAAQSDEALQHMVKAFLQNALQLIPLTAEEKAFIACEWTLKEHEISVINQANPKTNTSTIVEHEKLIQQAIASKIQQNIGYLLTHDEHERINRDNHEESARAQARLAVVQEKQYQKAVKKKTAKMLDSIFNSPDPWFLAFSKWMRQNGEGVNYSRTLKPLLVRLLSENSGVAAFSILMETFVALTEKIHAALKNKSKPTQSTLRHRASSILATIAGRPGEPLPVQSYDFSRGLFNDEMAALIDYSEDQDKKSIGYLMDSFAYGAQVSNIWADFFQKFVKALKNTPEDVPLTTSERDSDDSFDAKLNYLTKRVSLFFSEKYYDAPCSVEERLPNFLEEEKEEENLFSKVKESLYALHGLNMSWVFSGDQNEKEHMISYACYKVEDERLRIEFLAKFFDENSKCLIHISPQPPAQVVSFSKKILEPMEGLLQNLIQCYDDFSSDLSDDSKKNKESIKKQIIVVATAIAKIANSPTLLQVMTEDPLKKILLAMQYKKKSLLEAVIGTYFSENNIGVSVALLDDLRNVIDEDQNPVALPESDEKNIWDTAPNKISSVTQVNDYLYRRATETRYWHYFAFKWRARLNTTIGFYQAIKDLVKSDDPNVSEEGRNALFVKKRATIAGELGWAQLNYGGIWVDVTFFSKRPTDSLERALSLLSFVTTFLWSGWNLFWGLFLWRANTFAGHLKLLQEDIERLGNIPSTREALEEQLKTVIGALRAIEDDLAPNRGREFTEYIHQEDQHTRLGPLPEFKRRKEILSQYHLLKKRTGQDVPSVYQHEHWVDLLSSAGKRPSLTQNKIWYGVKHLGLGG